MTRSVSSTLDGLDVPLLLAQYLRVSLCHLPTPLERLSALSKKLGINLWVKRDDLTGLAFGGNKSRKLELVMGDVRSQGCDTVLSWAGVQSNWCRQLAAAARKCGMRPVLLLFRRPGLPDELDGNYLLDTLLGSSIHLRDLDGNRDMMQLSGVADFIKQIQKREEEEGHRVYVAPIGASRAEGSMRRPLGALSFVLASTELIEQAEAMGLRMNHLVTATSSGSMQAGLIAGFRLLNSNVKVTGIAVSNNDNHLPSLIAQLTQDVMDELACPGMLKHDRSEVIVHDAYAGEGYGLLDRETVNVIREVAEIEGLLLDPVYTAKAMRGLFDLAAKSYFQPGENVVFLHTGGLPALFPYRDIIRTFTPGIS